MATFRTLPNWTPAPIASLPVGQLPSALRLVPSTMRPARVPTLAEILEAHGYRPTPTRPDWHNTRTLLLALCGPLAVVVLHVALVCLAFGF